MAKTNGLRKNFAYDFSKKNSLVYVCVIFCLNFLVSEMGTAKYHLNNLSKIADTGTNHKKYPKSSNHVPWSSEKQ